MSELMLEKLNEAERICVDHLRQAQVLGVSFAEYCRSFELDLAKWYRVKQALARKGITVKTLTDSVAEVRDVNPAAEEKATPFARVQIAAAPAGFAEVHIAPSPAAPAVMCRIRHPSGWVIECVNLPEGSWMAALFAAGVHAAT
jgi:hypothetical protein